MVKNICRRVNRIKKKKKINLFICLILGLIVGVINGFFGGGGGMIVVPLLSFILNLEDRKAHATAILIILPLCAISATVYIIKGAFEWSSTMWCGIGAIAGGVLGALFLKKLSNNVVRIIFSVLMIGAGIKMIL